MTVPGKGNSRIGRVFGAPHHIKVHIESNLLRIGYPLLRKVIRTLHSALLSIPGTEEHRMFQRGFTLPEGPCKLQERSHAGGIVVRTRMNPWNGIRRALYHPYSVVVVMCANNNEGGCIQSLEFAYYIYILIPLQLHLQTGSLHLCHNKLPCHTGALRCRRSSCKRLICKVADYPFGIVIVKLLRLQCQRHKRKQKERKPFRPQNIQKQSLHLK